MLEVSFTSGATTAGTAIGITKAMSTNDNAVVSGSSINVKTPGIYEVTGFMTATSTAAASSGVGVYANGTLQGYATSWTAAASGETQTVPVYAVVDVVETTSSGYAAITFMPVGAATVVLGMATVKRIT